MESGNHHRDALRPWFEQFDAVGYARQKAHSFSRQAGAGLAALPATAACQSLAGLADFVINRRQ